MASIEKRISGRGKTSFRVKVRLKGYPAQSATFDRRTDAKKWAQQTEAALREGRYFRTSEASRHTLAELIDRFIEKELPRLPRVQALMRTQLLWWRERLGHVLLSAVTPAMIAECRDALAKEGSKSAKSLSNATVNRYLAALSIAYARAVNEWEWVEDSPVRRVKKLKEPKGRTRYLDDDERRRLLEACSTSNCPTLYPFVVLALSTGARKMELLTMRWSDVDLQRGLVSLHNTKNGESRGLPVRGHALETLREWGKVRRIDSPLVFPSPRKPLQPIAIQYPWTRALQSAEIDDFRIHDLRHSAASYLAMNGATLPEIAAILGHKTLQMVGRYAHLAEDHTAKVVESMNERIFG